MCFSYSDPGARPLLVLSLRVASTGNNHAAIVAVHKLFHAERVVGPRPRSVQGKLATLATRDGSVSVTGARGLATLVEEANGVTLVLVSTAG